MKEFRSNIKEPTITDIARARREMARDLAILIRRHLRRVNNAKASLTANDAREANDPLSKILEADHKIASTAGGGNLCQDD